MMDQGSSPSNEEGQDEDGSGLIEETAEQGYAAGLI
jgi:hypothetical protein